MSNELWNEYDNVAYFVGAAYASPQEEARMAELKALIIAAERRATLVAGVALLTMAALAAGAIYLAFVLLAAMAQYVPT